MLADGRIFVAEVVEPDPGALFVLPAGATVWGGLWMIVAGGWLGEGFEPGFTFHGSPLGIASPLRLVVARPPPGRASLARGRSRRRRCRRARSTAATS